MNHVITATSLAKKVVKEKCRGDYDRSPQQIGVGYYDHN